MTIAPAVAGRMARIFLDSMEGPPPPSVFVALVLLALAAFWPRRKDAA
ncbi:hypothetical protein [Brevundimonas sp.]